MSDLVRMSFTIDRSLYEQIEGLMKAGRCTNRSEFLRDLIREHLVARQWEANKETLCTLTLVYDHHKRRLAEKLTDIQHRHHGSVLAAMHVHLDEDLCAEAVLMKGRANDLIHVSDEMRRQKGVLHAVLSQSTAGGSVR